MITSQIHFEPVGHTLRHTENTEEGKDKDVHGEYAKAGKLASYVPCNVAFVFVEVKAKVHDQVHAHVLVYVSSSLFVCSIVKRRAGGHEADHHGLPSYIKEGSMEANRWYARHPDNNRVSAHPFTSTSMYRTALHCTALHCTALHCTALHCTALHCTVCILSSTLSYFVV
jgi:hypothetical protein